MGMEIIFILLLVCQGTRFQIYSNFRAAVRRRRYCCIWHGVNKGRGRAQGGGDECLFMTWNIEYKMSTEEIWATKPSLSLLNRFQWHSESFQR